MLRLQKELTADVGRRSANHAVDGNGCGEVLIDRDNLLDPLRGKEGPQSLVWTRVLKDGRRRMFLQAVGAWFIRHKQHIFQTVALLDHDMVAVFHIQMRAQIVQSVIEPAEVLLGLLSSQNLVDGLLTAQLHH